MEGIYKIYRRHQTLLNLFLDAFFVCIMVLVGYYALNHSIKGIVQENGAVDILDAAIHKSSVKALILNFGLCGMFMGAAAMYASFSLVRLTREMMDKFFGSSKSDDRSL